MLMGKDFVNAETDYRIQRLTADKQRGKSGFFRKAVVTVAIGSVLIATGGLEADQGDAATAQTDTASDIAHRNIQPTWEPDYALLMSILAPPPQDLRTSGPR